MDLKLQSLFKRLQDTPDGPFFNPWYQRDPKHDYTMDAPAIRKRQLRAYLEERQSSAEYLCIAEALGYQGGHFTGIAMTSERILLGYHKDKYGIRPNDVFNSIKPRRTSKTEVNPKGMTEPTATIMWKALYQLNLNPRKVVLWNALAWHPYDPEDGLLSNRTPTKSELKYGIPALSEFLNLFPKRNVIAVGKKCTFCLDELGVDYTEVRHPANGGATKFRHQFKAFLNS